MRLKFAFMSVALPVMLGLPLLIGGCDRRSGEAGQGAAPAANAGEAGAVTSDEVQPDAAGSEAAFKHTVDRSHKGEAPPKDSFTGPDGKPVALAAMIGKPLLVNLWATWCAPCIAELPALSALAAKTPAIRLVAVSQDAEGAKSVDPFLNQRKLTGLTRYLDPDNKLGFAYATGVLPTTVLYDAQGKEALRVVGALDWAGPEGQALLAEAQ